MGDHFDEIDLYENFDIEEEQEPVEEEPSANVAAHRDMLFLAR
jgi:hypothetical protein